LLLVSSLTCSCFSFLLMCDFADTTNDQADLDKLF
jgi:hypothetical protein